MRDGRPVAGRNCGTQQRGLTHNVMSGVCVLHTLLCITLLVFCAEFYCLLRVPDNLPYIQVPQHSDIWTSFIPSIQQVFVALFFDQLELGVYLHLANLSSDNVSSLSIRRGRFSMFQKGCPRYCHPLPIIVTPVDYSR